jgi:hypothetical protein
MCLSHETLMNYYQMNFGLMQHHKYSLEDLESMMPYEKEIYVSMLLEFLEQEKQRLQERNRR